MERHHGGDAPGFVGDVVLANVHFRLNCRLDRGRLRDAINAECGPFIASYEPLVHDVSVSVKHANQDPLPADGAVYPRWTLCDNAWSTVRLAEPDAPRPSPGLPAGPPARPWRLPAH